MIPDSLRDWLNKWGRIIFGTWLMIVSVALLIVAGMSFATQSQQEQLARAAKAQAEQIQTERAEGYRLNCYEQNARNSLALRRLRAITNDPKAINRTRLLIDALAPVKNCVELAESRVRSR